MQFSLPSIPKDKLIFLGFMVALFLTIGIGNHFYENRPPAPTFIIGHPLTLAGRGNLPPLHEVSTHDDRLRKLISDLSAVPAPQVFTREKDVDMMVANILFRWAGADMAQKEANGPYIDSRVVAFLKRIGSFPVTPGQGGTAGKEIDIKQATDLDQLWFKVFEHYRVPLLAQTAAKAVYGGYVTYESTTDQLTVTGPISPTFVKAFEAELQLSKNSGEAMRALLDFIDATKGFAKLSEEDQDLIMSVDAPKTAKVATSPEDTKAPPSATP